MGFPPLVVAVAAAAAVAEAVAEAVEQLVAAEVWVFLDLPA